MNRTSKITIKDGSTAVQSFSGETLKEITGKIKAAFPGGESQIQDRRDGGKDWVWFGNIIGGVVAVRIEI